MIAALDALLEEAAPLRRPRPLATQAPVIVARAEGPADVYLYGSVGWPGIDDGRVVEELRAHAGHPLLVHLNSPGGDVFAGLTIYNALQRHDAPVVVRVEGLAASIASVMALGGGAIRMARASMLMIHEPRGAVLGDAHDMRHMAGLLDKAGGLLADIYTKRIPDRDRVRAYMHKETWWTAQEALTDGWINAIDDEPIPAPARAASATFDLSAFRAAPLAPAPPAPAPIPIPPRARENARLLVESWRRTIPCAA